MRNFLIETSREIIIFINQIRNWSQITGSYKKLLNLNDYIWETFKHKKSNSHEVGVQDRLCLRHRHHAVLGYFHKRRWNDEQNKKRSKKIQFLVIMTVFERIIRNVVIRSSIIHELKCLKRFFFEKLSPIHIIVCGYHPKTEFQISISKNIPKIRLKTLWNLPYNKEFSHFDNLGSLRFSDDSCGQLESSRYLTEKVWDAIWTKK